MGRKDCQCSAESSWTQGISCEPQYISALPDKLSSKVAKHFVVMLFSYSQITSQAWDDEHFTQLECYKRNFSAQGSEVVPVGFCDFLDQAMFS
jgi:hypothetical protein